MSATVRDMMRLQTESEGLKAMTVELQEQVKELQSEKSVMRKELEKISAKAGKRKMIDDTIVYSRDGCLSSPCRYGGTCVEIGHGYRCLCRDGRKGNDCRIPPGKVACWRAAMCLSCSDDVVSTFSGYAVCCPYCRRTTEYIGMGGVPCLCDEEDTDECLSSPCQNGGTCQDLISSYRCICPVGYNGTNCEINTRNPPTPDPLCYGEVTDTCDDWVCPYERSIGQECVGGVCECPHPDYNTCTCLPNVTTCTIEQTQGDAGDAVASPRFTGKTESGAIYSCRANNERYNVIVIAVNNGVYSRHGWPLMPVRIIGTGNGKDIILVFSSVSNVIWNVTISDPGVTLEKAILVSKIMDITNIEYLVGSIRSLEGIYHKVYGFGDDRRGYNTVGLLKYLHQRFGPITSFTGTSSPIGWVVDLDKI
ncbi:uncharacterized protein [Ptychodera flava]|uniref:uncharacterized protein n=1 Tax=Ptychodera flava TaxID=63121 RepID=UPI00396A8DBE